MNAKANIKKLHILKIFLPLLIFFFTFCIHTSVFPNPLLSKRKTPQKPFFSSSIDLMRSNKEKSLYDFYAIIREGVFVEIVHIINTKR